MAILFGLGVFAVIVAVGWRSVQNRRLLRLQDASGQETIISLVKRMMSAASSQPETNNRRQRPRRYLLKRAVLSTPRAQAAVSAFDPKRTLVMAYSTGLSPRRWLISAIRWLNSRSVAFTSPRLWLAVFPD